MVVGLMLAGTVNAGSRVTGSVYGLAENWTWEETSEGQRFLKETGPLFGVGGELNYGMSKSVALEGRGNFWGGNVTYDGHLQSDTGELTPFKSNTEYYGLELDGDVALMVPLSNEISFKPYAGAGGRAWRRTLDKKFGSSEIGQYGYIENWGMGYGLAGVVGNLSLTRSAGLFVRVEGRLPVVVNEVADISNAGGPSNIQLKPGKRLSFQIEGGVTISSFMASLFMETMEFPESPIDDTGYAKQPDSKNTLVGVKAGILF